MGNAHGQALGWDLALGVADGHRHRQRLEMPQIQVQPVGSLFGPQFHDLWGLQSPVSMGFVLEGAGVGLSAAAGPSAAAA